MYLSLHIKWGNVNYICVFIVLSLQSVLLLQEVKEGEPAQQEEEEPGMWEESFKTFHDSKPYGKNLTFQITCHFLMMMF